TAFSAASNITVNVPAFALSPDGHALVFAAQAVRARAMLWIRSIDHLDARVLSGTEDAHEPLWSADRRWIGFFAEGKLKKIPAGGGAVQVITQTSPDTRGASWGLNDTIVFGSARDPIMSVPAAGGKATPVTVLDQSRQETTHRYPQFLPD